MNKGSKIFIAGHNGMVGSAIYRKLKSESFNNIIVRNRQELDLKIQKQVEIFFETHKPEYVFLAAAKVGGILANNSYPAEFIYSNLQIQNNIIFSAYKNNVKKVLFLGSSCIYPRNCPQPMKEEYLLTGFLEPTNEAYAIAKISGIKMCQFFYKQYNTNFLSIMPTNLYGQGDNFNLENSHVLPAMIRKFHEAKINDLKEVMLWGTGIARREFLLVDDLADASVFIMKNIDSCDIYDQNISHINVGTGTDLTIKELAELIKKIVGFTGEIVYDKTKPDGMPQKLLNVERINKMGWTHKTSLEKGIEQTYNWFCKNYKLIRS